MVTSTLTAALLEGEKLNLFNFKVDYSALALVCGQMARTHAIGIPFEANLRVSAESMTAFSKVLARSLERAADRISATGCSPAEAFAPEVDLFGPQFVARLDLGHRAGTLKEHLLALQQSYREASERRLRAREYVVSAVFLSVGLLMYFATIYFYISEVPK